MHLVATANRPDTCQNFTDMDRLAHHVVNAGRKKLKRLLQGWSLVERNHRRTRTFADTPGNQAPLFAGTKQKGLHGIEINVWNRTHPFIEFLR